MRGVPHLPHEERVAATKQRIGHDSAFAIHVFRIIWDAQTPLEKFTHQHGESDHRGFSPIETTHWCNLYDWLEATNWTAMTPQNLDDIREGMVKHAEQYIRLTDEWLASGAGKEGRNY